MQNLRWPMNLLALVAAIVLLPGAAAPRTILFIGNSFTYGARSTAERYNPEAVTHLSGMMKPTGGVPALFKTFTEEVGLDYAVSDQVIGSTGLGVQFALLKRRPPVPWDVVMLQDLSMLDKERDGDPAEHVRNAAAIAAYVHEANPKAEVDLYSTWSRPDLAYHDPNPWLGKPITALADDVAAADEQALAASHDLHLRVPVGGAFNRAIREGVADENPYDGIDPGKVNLWASDNHHASTPGIYLAALMIFGKVTGIDPLSLGPREHAASRLGLSQDLARSLQHIASEELAEQKAAMAVRKAPTLAKVLPASSRKAAHRLS